MKVQEGCSSIPSRLRLGLILSIVLIVISSPIVMLVNPTLIAAPLSKEPSGADAAPSTISQGDFTTQAPLQIPRTLQSTDLVNSLAFYEVTFITSTTGAIDKIRMDFPLGTNIAAAGLIERIGIGGGTLLKSGSSITFDVTTPVSIPAGTFIRLEMFGIKNPPEPFFFQATITTRNSAGNLIDGPSQTNTYIMKQVGTNDIADFSVTPNKPAESFMKKVTLQDNAGGNALGWNPDGVKGVGTGFVIDDPAVSNSGTTLVSMTVKGLHTGCEVTFYAPGQFIINCQTAPAEGDVLDYVVMNLPAHVS